MEKIRRLRFRGLFRFGRVEGDEGKGEMGVVEGKESLEDVRQYVQKTKKREDIAAKLEQIMKEELEKNKKKQNKQESSKKQKR